MSSPLARDALRSGLVSPALAPPPPPPPAAPGARRRQLWAAAAGGAVEAPAAGAEAEAAAAASAGASSASHDRPAAPPAGPLLALILSHAVVSGGLLAGAHTEYEVSAGAPGLRGPQRLQRRYREFRALHAAVAGGALASTAPAWAATWARAIEGFAFPPKVLLRPTRRSVVEARRAALEAFLALLVAAAEDVPEVREALLEFLGLD